MSDRVLINCSSASVQYLCQKDKRLAKAISLIGDISYETHKNGYSFLIHEIIEQMLSIKASEKIYGRLQKVNPTGGNKRYISTNFVVEYLGGHENG